MKCPACGASMKSKQVVCRKCYELLDDETLNGLSGVHHDEVSIITEPIIESDSEVTRIEVISGDYGRHVVHDDSGLIFNLISLGLGIPALVLSLLQVMRPIPNIAVVSLIAITGLWLGGYGVYKSRRGNSGYASAVIGIITAAFALCFVVYI